MPKSIDNQPAEKPSRSSADSTDISTSTVQIVDVVPVEASTDDEATNESSASSPDDSLSEDGAASSAPEVAGQAQVARKNWLGASLGFVRRHAVLTTACSLSLLLGGGIALLLRPAAPVKIVEAKRIVEKRVVYVASAHRHEPIQPLVPFEDLNPAIVELGRRLFHEPGLSSTGRMSCATCHPLDQGGTVHTSLPVGVNGEANRYNAPTVLNAALNCAQFWDGSVATLEEQVEGPIINPHELGSSWERVTKFLASDSYYGPAFKKSLEGEPTPERVRQALVAFERSLITVNSPFDQWLAGNEKALNSDQFGGYYLFKKFNCVACHQGAGVGGTMFQPMGVAKAYFSNDPSPADLGRFNFSELERDRHVFRVPQLRNVELTAPYLHDGSVETLEEVVAVMIEYQCGQEYNQEDIRRLTAFLKTLTGELPSSMGQLVSLRLGC
jgi:cytochrome c peroxidase